MMQTRSYRIAFVAAFVLHLSLIVLLMFDPASHSTALTMTAKKEIEVPQMNSEEQAIKAVSMDRQEVMKAVNQLKQERIDQQRAENNRQLALKQEADTARKQRMEEQHRLEQLKTETAKLALARKKQLAEEQRHLKEIAKQKNQEEKRLVEMKKQQQEEAAKLAVLKKQQADELARATKERELKAKSELEQKQRAAVEQAKREADNNARIAGEVDKYKALIIGAISRQWILPENADSTLSSQFRIRLAPTGAVLEVNLTRSSGDPILDRSAQSAIYKASPLPVPEDPAAFNVFRDISLTVRPENARG